MSRLTYVPQFPTDQQTHYSLGPRSHNWNLELWQWKIVFNECWVTYNITNQSKRVELTALRIAKVIITQRSLIRRKTIRSAFKIVVGQIPSGHLVVRAQPSPNYFRIFKVAIIDNRVITPKIDKSRECGHAAFSCHPAVVCLHYLKIRKL